MSIEIVAGLDEAQVCAAFELHREWARERGFEIDALGWADQMKAACVSGRFALWVAYDSGLPVGVVECHLVYDPMAHEHAAFAERGYILPAHRGSGVFRMLCESAMAWADWLGITVRRMSVEVGQEVARGLYEKMGFRPVSILMGIG